MMVLLIALLCSGGLAQPVNPFDTSHVLTLRGTVAGFVSTGPAGPHFYVLLDVTHPRGATEHWLIEGRPRAALLQAGWTFGSGGMLTSGSVIAVTAYALKPDVPVK